jgi:conjugative relaxase-like TrwC/TraI family protein
VISIRRMSLGSGFKYLMDSIAVGDGAPAQSCRLSRYYAESGTPPGIFLGGGLAGLDDGNGAEKGSQVTEEHLWQMLGMCADPITGKHLALQPNRSHPSGAKNDSTGVESIRGSGPATAEAPTTARIGNNQRAQARHRRAPVAGFDLTFSPSKSVSTVWATSDHGTKAVIYECHRRAIDYVLAYAEREVFHSRSGTNGVIQDDIDGVVAASFSHWDSRAGDPQLHDHVVVMNRAWSTSDGQWRTLDSRGLFKSVVTLSEIHQGVLSDLLTVELGWGWDGRARRHSDEPRWEITGVPETLMREFSQRSAAIEAGTRDLVEAFVSARGRQPSPLEIVKLRQQATLQTRPDKTHRSLADMTEGWRKRAKTYVGDDLTAWVSSLRDRNDLPLLRASDLGDEILADAAGVAVTKVAERRATFSRANILAEVHRQLHGVRFASPDDRIAVAERTAELATAQSLLISPPELHHTPQRFRRADGRSQLRAKGHEIYTTSALLEAEARLLDAGRRVTGPTVTVGTVATVTDTNLPGKNYTLSVDQALAVEQIATSGRSLDVLVGPAGTGKSTTMAVVRAAWEGEHGPGSVIGLAPSAAAAEVLADELGIDTENTAKWLTEHRLEAARLAKIATLRSTLASGPVSPLRLSALRKRLLISEAEVARWRLKAGQLVIVDEASLAGTFALDELMAAAGDAGAKVLLVGDHAQLTGVEAGGMFRSLVRDRADTAPELSDVRRFRNDWEKAASVELRVGNQDAIDAYQTHDRITDGGRDEMLDALYSAWKNDIDQGKTSLMIACDLATVSELNAHARAERVTAGQVVEDGLAVAGGGTAGVGDRVVTRQNNRLLATGRRWVKNGDQWTVTTTNEDESMAVKRANGGGEVVLPADYVQAHVELGYASTAHRAQGRSVDTAHAMLSPKTTREVLYVSATRGRETNRLYVDTHYDPDPQTGHDGVIEPVSAREVLARVLQNEGADVAAHDMIRREQTAAESLANLHAEYLTLATAAQADRWEALLDRSGLSDDELELVRASDTHGPLLAAFRDAEARGLDIEATLPELVHGRSLDGAEDVASVLHGRVDRWTRAAGRKRQVATNLVAGIIPRARGITDPDMARGLVERDQAMEARARALAEQAVEGRARWAEQLGAPPSDPTRRGHWMFEVSTVAAYRDRWDHTGRSIIGNQSDVKSIEQIGHHKRAHAAVERAMAITRAEKVEQAGPAPDMTVQADKGVAL